MCNKAQRYTKYLLSMMYLILGYSYIVYYISYTIRITNKLEGWAVMIGIVLLYFLAYMGINHILIRRILSNKLLIIIDVLLFVTLLTIVISDWEYEAYLHIKYQQRSIPISVSNI